MNTNRLSFELRRFNFLFLVLLLFHHADCMKYMTYRHRVAHHHQFVPQTLDPKFFNLKDYQIHYYIDSKNKKACDIQVKEIITYNNPKGFDKIMHSILSKKLPYSDFKVNSKTPGVSITSSKIEKSNKHKKYFINKEESQIYRDRWLFNVILNKNTTNAVIEYEYTIQRAIMIDPLNEYDLIRISVINPFSKRLENLKFSVHISNFKNLDNENIRIPPYSTITRQDKNNIEINTVRSLPVYGQLFMQFTLPMEITVCEPEMVKFVYYGMIGMTASFAIIALVAFAMIYKE